MSEFVLTGKLLDVAKNRAHRDDREAKIDSKSLGKLILESVGTGEEHDLGVLRPSLEELLSLLPLNDLLQHFIIK